MVAVRDITERKQAEEALFQQVERRAPWHMIVQAIVSSMDLKTLLELLVREIVGQLQVDAVSVLLLNPQKETLDFAAGQGFITEALKFTSLKIGNGLAGTVREERQIVHVDDLAKLENDPVLARCDYEWKIRCVLWHSLDRQGPLARGVLEIFHRSALSPDPNWLQFLETLAGQAAISIDNARLLEMTQVSLKETDALYRINQDMASTVDLRAIDGERGQPAAGELRLLLRADICDPSGNRRL